MNILFLDDDEERHKTFKRVSIGHYVSYAYDADAAIAALSVCDFDVVYLDHDLGGEASQNRMDEGAKDGRYVARWIAQNAERFSAVQFIVHSLNFGGATSMIGILRDVGLLVFPAPFAWRSPP